MTGGDPQTDKERARKANWPVHFAHGTAVGAVLAALSLLGLSGVVTTVIFYVLVVGGDWLLYSALGVTKASSGAEHLPSGDRQVRQVHRPQDLGSGRA